MIFSPISVLLSTPFIRPIKPDRLLFTYLIPILPLFVMWDGIISVLRTYTVEELNSIILELNHHEQFDWEVGIAKGRPVDVGFLLGTPKNQST